MMFDCDDENNSKYIYNSHQCPFRTAVLTETENFLLKLQKKC